MSALTDLNNLFQQENQVFRFVGPEDKDNPGSDNPEGPHFDYSDGQAVERYLQQTFKNATDLGCRSQELQDKIIDWPSEYHLSSDRANLLRPFDLSFAQTALEFGSGCGAISRYLGEQGIEVDAVEGSAVRAHLGKMRCRDLDNVAVINANYNDLEYPAQAYDLILFVGVIEYARKFHDGAKTDRDAAIAILKDVRRYLKPGGVILVAIENRLGLKYILGQHEDHYSKKYIGIHGYPDSAGIATYSQSEWRELALQAEFTECQFAYPFPDYKIPRVMLGEQFARENENAFNHLEGIYARDYTRPVKKSPTESIAWQAASSGQFLGTIANSFCLALSNSEQQINALMDFDFCHMPGPSRKNKFAVVTRKATKSNNVEKIPLIKDEMDTTDAGIQQVLSEQPYLRGRLLSADWLRTILIYSRREEFDSQIALYYSFLGELENQGETLKIDMLPINIIVDDSGGYHLFDQEWETEETVSREYLLFRALLTFIVANWVHLKDFLGWLELHSVRDFIDYGFRDHGLLLDQYIDQFIRSENQFQKLTTNSLEAEKGIQQLLDTRFDFSLDDRKIYAALYWSVNEEPMDETQKVEISLTPDPQSQTVKFDLNDSVRSIKQIRFDPFDIRKTEGVGFYSVSKISVLSRDLQGGNEKTIWHMQGEQTIADHCDATSVWFEPLSDRGYWLSSTDFPKMQFKLDEEVVAGENQALRVLFEIRIAESKEYILAQQKYLSRVRQFEQTEKDLKATLTEIEHIKAGKLFRLGMKIFSLLGVLKR